MFDEFPFDILELSRIGERSLEKSLSKRCIVIRLRLYQNRGSCDRAEGAWVLDQNRERNEIQSRADQRELSCVFVTQLSPLH